MLVTIPDNGPLHELLKEVVDADNEDDSEYIVHLMESFIEICDSDRRWEAFAKDCRGVLSQKLRPGIEEEGR